MLLDVPTSVSASVSPPELVVSDSVMSVEPNVSVSGDPYADCAPEEPKNVELFAVLDDASVVDTPAVELPLAVVSEPDAEEDDEALSPPIVSSELSSAGQPARVSPINTAEAVRPKPRPFASLSEAPQCGQSVSRGNTWIEQAAQAMSGPVISVQWPGTRRTFTAKTKIRVGWAWSSPNSRNSPNRKNARVALWARGWSTADRV